MGGHHADGDEDRRHAQAEGRQEDQAQPQAVDRLGQEDQDHRVPARDDPAGQAEADQAPHAGGIRLGLGNPGPLAMLAVAAEMAAEPPEADGRDHEAGPLRQPSVDLDVRGRPGQPEGQGDRQDAPHVGRGNHHRQHDPPGPAPPLAERGGRHQRLAVAGLDRVRRAQREGDQHEPQPRDLRAVQEPREIRASRARRAG